MLHAISRQSKIVMANNGLEALEAIKKENFDLILMDGQMPEMDGLEATKIIRQSLPKEEFPIIGITANAMKGDRERFLATGMNTYLPKPVNKLELMRAIWYCVKGKVKEKTDKRP